VSFCPAYSSFQTWVPMVSVNKTIFESSELAGANSVDRNVGRVLRLALKREGLTLIEVMIALTMTLIVLGAMMTAFASVSSRMQQGRAMIELANRVRNVESTLRSDLTSMTVEPRPYTTTLPSGFFQIVEGGRSDAETAVTVNSVIGDVDDVLSMTIQSKGKLFRGRQDINFANPTTVGSNIQILESPLAEVVWFTYWNEKIQNNIPDFEDIIELHRRVLLIRPDISLPGNLDLNEVRRFFLTNDISARIEVDPNNSGRFRLVANQVGDLAIRKNRFGHFSGVTNGAPNISLGFPNRLEYQLLASYSFPSANDPAGVIANKPDDIVLTDVVGFDVRVFSPNAHLKADTGGSMAIEPGDIALPPPPNYIDHGDFGAFVDLGFQDLRPRINEPLPWFSGNHNFNGSFGLNIWPDSTWPAPIGFTKKEFIYDTWTPAYESDGIDQDGNGVIDQGTDGLDNNNLNGVDDIGERETVPPYSHPIRGIEIRIRTVERVTKQVHQTTIIQSFVPE
jgi:hypothetical protein